MRTLSGPPRAPALSDFRASWGERSGLAPAQSGVGRAWSTEPYRRGGDLSGSGGRPPSPGPRGRNLRPAIWGKRGPHATRGPSGTRGPTPPPSAPVGTPRTTVRSGTGTVSQVASVLKRWGALEAISGQSGTAFPWRPPGQSCPSPALPGPGVHRGPALRREAGPEERAFLFLARRPPSRGPGADQARVTMNNPIPSNLKSEAKKAAKILREFTEITSRNGPDKIIPAHVIAKAKGLAVLSVIKAGFLVTARGGSGIVLARLPDGKWSAPSAIGIAGLGGGFEIGIEVSDLVIILNYGRAVEAFAKGGNLTLGGNLTVAVGPLGRNLEGNVALRSSAAVFTYCRSRGLFAGISLEGSCLIERKETNRKFYCQDVRAYDILFGDMPRPAQAEDLYEILDAFTEKYESEGQRINARRAARERRKALAQELPPKPLSRPQPSSPQGPLSSGSQSDRNEYKLYPELPSYPERVGNSRRPTEVTALYSFEGQQPGDLSFKAGDRITVTSKTDSNFDWWEGSLRGQTGIFPANYVTMN